MVLWTLTVDSVSLHKVAAVDSVNPHVEAEVAASANPHTAAAAEDNNHPHPLQVAVEVADTLVDPVVPVAWDVYP
jgi:hypothetical protein